MISLVLNKQSNRGIKILPKIGLKYLENRGVLPTDSIETELIQDALLRGGELRLERGVIKMGVL